MDVEIAKTIPDIWAAGDDTVVVMVRCQGRPLGWLSFDSRQHPRVSADRLRETIVQNLGWEIVLNVLAREEPGRPPAVREPLSVIVYATESAAPLLRTLQALLAQDHPADEILILDASGGDEVEKALTDMPVRYLRQDRRGLNAARNRGIAEARHDVLVFIDSETIPDRTWLRWLTRALEPGLMMATGLVAPAQLDTSAQLAFEHSGYSLGRGLRRQLVHSRRFAPDQLLTAGAFGTGLNMVVRREAFADVGCFDVTFDRIAEDAPGGDVEMIHRLITGGHTLVYEPAAIVWRASSRSLVSMRRMAFDRGRGYGAFLLSCARDGTARRPAVLRHALRRWLAGDLLRRLRRPGTAPRHVVALELAGAILSPFVARRASSMRSVSAGAGRSSPTGTGSRS